jgi:hypothetical protein
VDTVDQCADIVPNNSYVTNTMIVTTTKIIAYSVFVGLMATSLGFFAFMEIPSNYGQQRQATLGAR